MAGGNGYSALRDAISKAQAGTGAELEMTEVNAVVAATLLKCLQVRYKAGNEYLRLDRLYEALGQVGAVKAFEYRGRGREPQEGPSIVADIHIGDERYQVIYHLS